MPSLRLRRQDRTRPTLEVVILAGGQSSRMGQDKARLRLHRRSLLAHARASGRELGVAVRVIRRDRIARCGPLGGIYTALKSSQAKSVLFLACDMPFVRPALLRRLLAGLRAGDDAAFVVAGRRAGFPFIIRSRCAVLVKKEILLGRLSLQELANTLQARRLRVAPSERPDLFNINTPEDLRIAHGRAADRS